MNKLPQLIFAIVLIGSLTLMALEAISKMS
jgi:hypothetical protein